MEDGKRGIVGNFRNCTADYLDRVSQDLGLGLGTEEMTALQNLYAGEKRNPTVSELRLDAAVACAVRDNRFSLLTGEISFSDKNMRTAFSRAVDESGLAKKNRAGLSLPLLAARVCAGGKKTPGAFGVEICETAHPVFPRFPSETATAVYSDGFRIGLNRNPPEPASVRAESAVMVFPQAEETAGDFMKRAVPFAARAVKSRACRVIPCGRTGLLFDLMMNFGSASVRIPALPGSPDDYRAAARSYAPAFILACPAARAQELLKSARDTGFRASVIASSFYEPDTLVIDSPDGRIKLKREHLIKTMLFRRSRYEAGEAVLADAEAPEVFPEDPVNVGASTLSGDAFAAAEAALETGKTYAVCGYIGDDGTAPGLIVALQRAVKKLSPDIAAAAFLPSPDGTTRCTVFSFSPEEALREAANAPRTPAFGFPDAEKEPAPAEELPGRGKIFKSVEELCGQTPLLEVYPGLPGRILCKLELFNPAGSVKDRVAVNMIKRARESGQLKDGSVIIEATSGNTGIGLAAYGSAAGYRVIIVMPDSMSRERIDLMKAYGAEVVLTPGAEGMSGAAAEAARLAETIPGSFVASQFDNPANPEAHELTTGPELLKDTGGKIDLLVAGIGTGGTLCGTARYLKRYIPGLVAVGCEPASSPMITEGRAGKHKIQGIGANFVPANYDPSVVDRVTTVTDEEAYAAALAFARDYGLLTGISSGCALAAAKKIASLPENIGKTIVAILPDTGEHYISTGMFGE